MAYSDSIVDIADRTKRSILDDLEWAATFGNTLKNNFVEEQRIPEALSETRLNDANNRFNLQQRNQNWANDLLSSNYESQLGVRTNQYALEDFDSARQAERIQRDAVTSNNILDMKNNQRAMELFDQETINQNLDLQLTQLEAEGNIQKATFDRMYESLREEAFSMIDPNSSSEYDAMMKIAKRRNSPPAVKSRIIRNFLETEAEAVKVFRLYDSIISGIRRELSSGANPNDPSIVRFINMAESLSKMGLSPDVVKFGSDNGVFNIDSAGAILNNISVKELLGIETAAPEVQTSTQTAQQPITDQSTEQDIVNTPVPQPQDAEQTLVEQPLAEQEAAPEQVFSVPENVLQPSDAGTIAAIENLPSFPQELKNSITKPINSKAEAEKIRLDLIAYGRLLPEGTPESVYTAIANRISQINESLVSSNYR